MRCRLLQSASACPTRSRTQQICSLASRTLTTLTSTPSSSHRVLPLSPLLSSHISASWHPASFSPFPVRVFATHTIPVPSVADSISECTLAAIQAQPGEAVKVDDVVATLDTDKVSVDVRSTVSGVVKAWEAKVGDTVKVGSPLLKVEEGATPTPTAGVSQKESKPVSTPPPSQKSAAPTSSSSTPAPATAPSASSHDHEQGSYVPSIQFRHGKGRDQVQHRPHQQQQQASGMGGGVVAFGASTDGLSFTEANLAAARAQSELPERYRTRTLKAQQLLLIEMGGAEDYEPKKKKGRA